MRIVVFPITPAQVHTSRNITQMLESKGHQVKVIVREHDSTLELLDAHNIEYAVCGKAGRSKYLKYAEALPQLVRAYIIARKFKPDVLFGFGAPTSFISLLLRKPCFLLGDTDVKSMQTLFLTRNPFVKAIFTPLPFKLDLGGKHLRLNMYKELAYIHPNYFHPDSSIYEELGISKDDKYVILRFNAFDAVHDIGRRGFSLLNKYQLVRELEKYARVFISAEGSLPEDLEGFKLPIPYHRIHHALYYAQLLVCDTGTMATEAAILGTPSIHCSSAVGQFGNFIELEQKYDLIYCFREPHRAIQKALELIQQPDLKEQWAKKRQRLLADKIDVTQFMVWFIENYPQSFEECRRSQAGTGNR